MNWKRVIATTSLLAILGLTMNHWAQGQATPTSTRLTAAAGGPAGAWSGKHTFAIGDTDFLLDGQRLQIRCGEVHAARVPREYWRNRLQTVHAMGLNTVCAYLFWNMHEPKEGQFNWSGQADVAEFCKIAQEEGLWVVLRPGPYACAEWEMGGFPWWLLKHDDIKLRTRDPNYMNPAKAYLKEVGRELGPLQITHGGPILMVQVENEYGFYGKDAAYMGEMRQALLDAGIDVPLFACNPTDHLKDGYRADLFPVVNFGSDPARSFRTLRSILPKGPLMCGEFYPGWFDTWGVIHHSKSTPADMNRYLTDLEYMLANNNSFSIYMAHGGTTFGLWSGADRPFKPDTSSYDYDAPVSEAGWTTEKFFKTRDVISKHLLPGEKLPDPPAKNPVMAFPAVSDFQCAAIRDNLPAPIQDETPRGMEMYDQGYGWIMYRTTLPAGAAGTLEAKAVHDYGQVFIDGQRIGFMDRRSNHFKVAVPAREKLAQLDILVETAGRVNFGQEVHDSKGLFAPVTLTGQSITGWQVFPLPLDPNAGGPPANLKYTKDKVDGPAFWKFNVNLAETSDTFLDMHPWGQGVAWVNGHCLGRFWNIGPTQTMYCPGPWLKVGSNEVVILDFVGPQSPTIAGVTVPVLNELRPALDYSHQKRPEVTLALDGVTPVAEGSFAPGAAMQEVMFRNTQSPPTGRFFALEALSSHDGKPFAAVAELDLLDEAGKPLSHEGWTIAYVDSEERDKEDGAAENAIDGQIVNFWHTQWGDAQPPYPHRLILDLGQSRTITGIRYTPRQGATATGRIKDYKIYVGDGLVKK